MVNQQSCGVRQFLHHLTEQLPRLE